MKHFIRIAALLALALCLTVAGASAADPVTVTLEADGAFSDLALPAAGEAAILDLNGHALTGGNTKFTLAGTLTIRDGSAAGTGRITGSRIIVATGAELTLESGTLADCTMSSSGAAVSVQPGAVFTMAGGAITGNRTTGTNSGGAVLVNGGTFTMTGGTISGNASAANGGAICVAVKDGTAGTFTMNGGTISGNTAAAAGGAVVMNGGTFTMSGGSLAGNRSAELGGAVLLNGGEFTMTGGAISENESTSTAQATARGGAVYVKAGSFTMTDGVISGNAAGSAGAVGLTGGTFTMSGGSLTGNKAGLRDGEGNLTGGLGIGGGAIASWSESVVITITGGSVTGNSAFTQGGAMTLYAGLAEFSNVTVSGNKVTRANTCYGGAVFVGGASSSADEEKKLHRLVIGEGCLFEGNGPAAELPSGKYIYGTALFAGRGGEIVMNGGTVGDNSANGANGVIHLWNSGPGHMTMNGGTVTGSTTRSGPIWVAANADFTMTGGVITGNTATNTAGGGVFLNDAGAVFTMTGGTISENVAQTQPGGGVGVRGGTFTMSGGSVTGNSTQGKQNGGGVAVYNSAVFAMSDGAITGNTAGGSGGGLYVSGSAAATLSGGRIVSNSSTTINCDLYMTGAAPRFTMTGGQLGDHSNGQNAMWAWNSAEANVAYVDIAGGTVNGVIGASGDNTANEIHLWNGNFYRLPESSRKGITIHGGRFYNPGYTVDLFDAETVELAYSGAEVYRYQFAPVLTSEIALNAAGTQLNAVMDGAEAAWTYYNGVGTTAVRVPATATLRVGEHVTEGLAVTSSGGQYKVSAPIAEDDKGGQYQLTLLDGEGQPVRAFAGHVDEIVTSGGPDGDLTGDGKTNAKDIVLLQRFIAGGYGVTLETAAADLTGDGKTNAKDVVLLQRFVAGGYGVELGGGGDARVADDPHEDDEFNILLLGNSYSYYWPDELWGLLDAAGYKNLTICNIYYSGCKFYQHWDWYLNGAANYKFCINDKDGRREVPDMDLNSCVAYKNWDIIDFQQSGSYMYSGGESAHRESIRQHLPLLYNFYMYERFPHADFYWMQSWVHELAHDDSVTTVEEQQAVCDSYRTVAGEVCAQYGFTDVPCGDAWQKVRYDDLFTVNGRTLTTRIYQGQPDYDDFTHDGDVGGGQYLNACVWFETITKTSCVGNTFRPRYVYKGTDLSLSEAQIEALQNAAHEAVTDYYGADFYK